MSGVFNIRSFIGSSNDSWADPGFHHHPSLEISIILEGSGIFEWAESKSLLELGQVVIVPPHLEHRFEGIHKNRFGVIHLENIPEQLAALLDNMISGGKPGILALSRLDKDRFERLFREWQRIKISFLKEKTRNETAWMEVLVLFILEYSQAGQQSLSITKAADYIRENLQKGLQISDLAILTGLTESGFRRLFEQIYDISPKQYQHQCRMVEAKWLLSSSGKEIHEIAEQIGFQRLHSFSQWFKKQEGISPSEWRSIQRKNFG